MFRVLGREDPLAIDLRPDPGSHESSPVLRGSYGIRTVRLVDFDDEVRILDSHQPAAALRCCTDGEQENEGECQYANTRCLSRP